VRRALATALASVLFLGACVDEDPEIDECDDGKCDDAGARKSPVARYKKIHARIADEGINRDRLTERERDILWQQSEEVYQLLKAKPLNRKKANRRLDSLSDQVDTLNHNDERVAPWYFGYDIIDDNGEVVAIVDEMNSPLEFLDGLTDGTLVPSELILLEQKKAEYRAFIGSKDMKVKESEISPKIDAYDTLLIELQGNDERI